MLGFLPPFGRILHGLADLLQGHICFLLFLGEEDLLVLRLRGEGIDQLVGFLQLIQSFMEVAGLGAPGGHFPFHYKLVIGDECEERFGV